MQDDILIGSFPVERFKIFDAVNLERDHQEFLWGSQSWPDGTTLEYTWIAEAYKDACNQATERGELTWHDIFLEEVFEAMAEADPDALEHELIQAIAVAVNWIEDIRRKRNG